MDAVDGTDPLLVRRRSGIWIALGVGAVLLGLVVVLATRPGVGRGASSALVGGPVPEISGVGLDGSRYDNRDDAGRWLVVNFFSTWCGPCVREHPELVAFDEAHGGLGDARLVSVVFDDDPDTVRDFFSTNGRDWPVLIEGTEGVPVDFGVTGVPESYLVAPDGTVVAKWISGVTAREIDDTIAELSARAPSE